MKSEPFGPSYKRVSHPIVRILSSPYFKLVDALEMHSAFYLGDNSPGSKRIKKLAT